MMTLRCLFPPLLVLAIASGLHLSDTSAAVQEAGQAYQIAEYAVGDPDLQAAMLDEWTLRLKQDPTYDGYVIAYAGREGDAQKAGVEAIDYVVMTHGVDRARLSIVDGGYRESAFIELWIASDRASLPPPTPTKK